MISTSRRSFLAFALLLVAWCAALVVAPAERVLGSTVRWVYAHASLTQVSLLLFMLAMMIAIIYLLGRNSAYAWLEASSWVALGTWLFGFLLSTIPARLSWGVWIDFSEPRTQMTLRVLAVGVIFLLLVGWVDSRRFAAIAQIVLSAAILYLNRSTSIIRHPLNPIASSTSPDIPMAYGLIFLLALLASATLIVLLAMRRAPRSAPATIRIAP